MDNQELLTLLNNVEEDINTEIKEMFENSELYKKSQSLIELTIFNDDLDDEIIKKIDILTDNMDKLNFADVIENIDEIKKLIKE